ncbi:MAG: TRAP transporter small permease [Syntrophorhabdaceae bacterium]|nr:TRAP transporter small permease [Syntrophorhabdaceae bacterium]
MGISKKFIHFWNLLTDMIMVLAGILLWGQMIIVNIEVVSRYLGRPTTWVPEISSIIILWVPFMVAGWVLRRDAHVKMDLIVERLKPKNQALINLLTSLTGAFVMIVVAVTGLLTTISWLGNRTPTILMLPRTPIIAIIPFGCFIFAVQFLIRTVEYYRLWREGGIKKEGWERIIKAEFEV